MWVVVILTLYTPAFPRLYSAGLPVIELPSAFQFHPTTGSAGVDVSSEKITLWFAHGLLELKTSVGATGTAIVLLATLMHPPNPVTVSVAAKSPGSVNV